MGGFDPQRSPNSADITHIWILPVGLMNMCLQRARAMSFRTLKACSIAAIAGLQRQKELLHSCSEVHERLSNFRTHVSGRSLICSNLPSYQ